MTTFSLITFSRTSLYLASISLLLPLIIKLQFSIKKIFFSSVLILSFIIIMVPIFDEYSGGLFSKRFSSIDSSGRFDISLAEIEIFQIILYLELVLEGLINIFHTFMVIKQLHIMSFLDYYLSTVSLVL